MKPTIKILLLFLATALIGIVLVGNFFPGASQDVVCGVAPAPRLIVPGYAIVTDIVGASPANGLRVRSSASINGTQVAVLPVRTLVQVIDGPVCSDGFFWYRLRFETGNVEGWSAEGQTDAYYLQRTAAPTAAVAATLAPADAVATPLQTILPTLPPSPESVSPSPQDATTPLPPTSEVPADRASSGEVGPTDLPSDDSKDDETTSTNTNTQSAAADGKQAGWTVLVYMAADNDLERFSLNDLNEMENVGSTDDVNIVVQIDRAEGYDTRAEDWTDTRRYLVREGFTNDINSSRVDNELGEANMGDPQTLIDFATWGVQNYPAKHYALIIWDHGGSWTGIGFDNSADNDSLSMSEMSDALKTITQQTGIGKFDLLGFDACLMSGFEVYNSIAPYGRYAVASAELIPGDGWAYETPLFELIDNPSMEPDEFGNFIVESFYDYYTDTTDLYDNFLLSLVDLDKIQQLGGALRAFRDVVEETPEVVNALFDIRSQTLVLGGFELPFNADAWSAMDLFQFMEQASKSDMDSEVVEKAQIVLDMAQSVILNQVASESLADSGGISIFFPRNQTVYEDNRYLPRYDTAADGANWRNFLTQFYAEADNRLRDWPLGQILALSADDANGVNINLNVDSEHVGQLSLAVALEGSDGQPVVIDFVQVNAGAEQTSWGGTVPSLSDEKIEVPVLLVQNPTNPNSGVIEGMFYPQNGEHVEAQMVVNIATGKPRTIWALNDTGDGLMPARVDVQAGDAFEPYWLSLDDENQLVSRPSGQRFTFGEDKLKALDVIFEPASPDVFTLTLITVDVSGNSVTSTVTVPVTETGVDVAAAVLPPVDDVDQDGVLAATDNCPTVPNPDQADSDADGMGNLCDVRNDLDLDRDSVLDAADNCPVLPNADQADSDSDGQGNLCDALSDASEIVPVDLGQTVTGTLLPNTGGKIWRFESLEGQTVTIQVEAIFDTRLTLFSSDETVLTASADESVLSDSQLPNIVLPQNSEYYVLVEAVNPEDGGDYVLSIQPAATTATNILETGVCQSGTLLANETKEYTFEGKAGQPVQVEVQSDFDSLLTLLDNVGNPLELEDIGTGEGSLLDNVILPADETYVVRVRGNTELARGAFSLCLNEIGVNDVSSRRILPNEPITDVLPSGAESLFTFEGAANQAIAITLTGDFDTELTLFDSNNVQIAYNDDFNGSRYSKIDGFALPAAGQYTLRVASYANRAGGTYTVVLEESTPVIDTPLGNLAYGDTVTDSLASGEQDLWTFSANVDDVATLVVEGAFDTTLTIFDAEGNVVAFNDDAGGLVTSRLNEVRLNGGQYRVVVGSFFGAAAGNYTLTLTRSEIDATIVTDQTIAIGQSANGNYGEGSEAYLSFTGETGQIITLEVNGDYDQVLTLLNSAGTPLAQNSDLGDVDSSLIENFLLTESGTYFVRVANYNDRIGGTYALVLSEGQSETPAVVSTEGNNQTLEIGQPTNGNLEAGESADWAFAGQAGQVITLEVEGNFDTTLTLLDSGGGQLDFNDDFGGIGQSRIENFTLISNGTYIARIGSYGDGDAGTYTLTVRAIQITALPDATTVASEGGLSITIGQSQEGRLENDAQQNYTFSGQAGQVITAGLTARFDTLLTLLDASGTQIAYNDDFGGTLNSRIENVTLPTSGTYTLQVAGFGRRAAGRFTLSLSATSSLAANATNVAVAAGSATPNPTSQFIAPGQSRSATLAYGSLDSYVFNGQAGQVMTIALEGVFDTTVALLDPNGSQVGFNDDFGGTTNSRLSNVTLSVSGSYAIRVASFGNRGAGGYTLNLSVAAASVPTATLPPAPQSSTSSIGLGQTVNGTLDVGQTQVYSFAGQAGQVITIALNAGNNSYDPVVTLLNGANVQVAFNDDFGTSNNSRIENFALTTSDTYSIRLGSYRNRSGGAFNLSLSASNAPAVPTATSVVSVIAGNLGGGLIAGRSSSPINFGQPLNGTLSAGQQLYTFGGQAGQVINIAVNGNFDTTVGLLNAGNTQIAFNDDAGGTRNSLIANFVLPTTANYSIRVGGFGNAIGTFNVSLTLVSSPAAVTPTPTANTQPTTSGGNFSINFGQIANGTLPNGGQQLWSFTGSAGQVVTIGLNAVNNSWDPTVALVSSGTRLAFNDDTNGNNSLISNFPLPANGRYIISVASFAGGIGGDFTLSLTSASPVASPTPTSLPSATPASGGGAMAIGQTVNGTLPAGTTQDWLFVGNIGEVISITLNGSFDTTATLLNSAGQLLAYNDDFNGTNNSFIGNITLSATDNYFVRVGGFNGAGGTYSLNVALSAAPTAVPPTVTPAPPPTVVPPSPTPGVTIIGINFFDTVTGALNPGQIVAYSFTVQAGQSVTITTTSDFNMPLAIMDTNFQTTFAYNGDTPSALYNVVLPGGTFYAVVNGANFPSTGNYILSLNTP